MTFEEALQQIKNHADGKYGTNFTYLNVKTAQAWYEAISGHNYKAPESTPISAIRCADYNPPT